MRHTDVLISRFGASPTNQRAFSSGRDRYHLNGSLFRRRQAQSEAGLFARQRFPRLAAGRNCPRGRPSARLPRLARDFRRCVPGQSYYGRQPPDLAGHRRGNTLEAVAGAWLVHRFTGGTKVFDRAQGVFKFALAVIVSTLISPTLGLTSLAVAGFAKWADYADVWLTWWLGDIAGDLLVAPLIILWSGASTRRWDRAAIAEVISLLLLLFVLGQMVFGGWLTISAKNYPIALICGAIVIWTAFRFTQRETATGIFILSALAVWGTLHGYGPFVMHTENESLLILQTSTAVLIITAMALAAGMAERRRAEAAIEQQRAAVEAANLTKDNFLAMLSHELRTPLTPVLAALDALKTESAPPDELKATLAMMRRNIELESQLIDDLLDLTRITKDKLQLQFESVDAHQAISNVVEMCAVEAEEKKLEVRFDLRAGDFHVMADPAKFQQIIWNLVKNAIKFTNQNGAITISSANHLAEHPDHRRERHRYWDRTRNHATDLQSL